MIYSLNMMIHLGDVAIILLLNPRLLPELIPIEITITQILWHTT
jgi:hypothetical protein